MAARFRRVGARLSRVPDVAGCIVVPWCSPADSRLGRIFIHRCLRRELTLLPPTGSSWIAVVRRRPRPSCPPHRDRPPGGGADRGSCAGVNGRPAGRPDAAGLGGRALEWAGCRPGTCGPRAIRGGEADASPGSSSRPGFRQGPGARERGGGAGRCGPGSPGCGRVRLPGASRLVVPSR